MSTFDNRIFSTSDKSCSIACKSNSDTFGKFGNKSNLHQKSIPKYKSCFKLGQYVQYVCMSYIYFFSPSVEDHCKTNFSHSFLPMPVSGAHFGIYFLKWYALF